MQLLKSLADRLNFGGRASVASLAPGKAIAVIGDVHGRADLLGGLLRRLGQEVPNIQVVLTGDLIDRGPESHEVIARLRALPATMVLRGNHEQMLLNFLDAENDEVEAKGRGWLRVGGMATVTGYGIACDPPPRRDEDQGDEGQTTETSDLGRAYFKQLRTDLRRAFAPGTEDWLQALPFWWQSGNVAVVHAGADPRAAIAQQNPDHCLWGHPAFGRFPRRDGIWVVHGHVNVPKPTISNHIISIDTGAYKGGGLSAAIITDGHLRFMTEH